MSGSGCPLAAAASAFSSYVCYTHTPHTCACHLPINHSISLLRVKQHNLYRSGDCYYRPELSPSCC